MPGTSRNVSIRSWNDANKYYEEHPKRNWPRVKLYYATKLGVDVSPHDGTRVFHLYYHGSEVIRWYKDGSIVINNHGYYTNTTRERLNSHMPIQYRIYQRKFEWYMSKPNGTFPYENGYLLDAS